jgi:signal transduction histidine kinase
MLGRWAKDDPAALQESIDALKNEADGMQNLVEQLLFLSRGEQGSIPMQSAPVNVSRLVAEVCGETMMIDDKHVYKHDAPEFCYVLGDAGLLKQALRALMDNARKYTPAGGDITLSCKLEDGKVRISVEDTGIGIEGEDVPRIFDRFFRADESRARKTGGSGLGLSIAKWIIDRHYGIIEVLSRKGLGTRITFSLPECKNFMTKQYI